MESNPNGRDRDQNRDFKIKLETKIRDSVNLIETEVYETPYLKRWHFETALCQGINSQADQIGHKHSVANGSPPLRRDEAYYSLHASA